MGSRFITMRRILIISLAALSACACSRPPDVSAALIDQNTAVRVSDHVLVIPSRSRDAIPNVGLITGSNGSLVIDTGLGRRNGEIVWQELQKVHRAGPVFVAATHFHPEHVGGEQAFPPEARVLRLEAQQQELDSKGEDFLAFFRKRSEASAELLQDFSYRKADVLFDKEHTIDLGDVQVKLFTLGPAHTRGDLLVQVLPDNVLFGGDIVQKELVPMLPDADSSAVNWLAILDPIEQLQPRVIVPSHGEIGDATLIAANREFLQAVRTRVFECRAEGLSEKEAGRKLREEFAARYPQWRHMDALPGLVARFYAEL